MNFPSLFLWQGEQPPTEFDDCFSRHIEEEKTSTDVEKALYDPLLSTANPNFYYNSTSGFLTVKTIRCQVVVWNIGKPNVLTSRVPVKFRLTLFWNEEKEKENKSKDVKKKGKKSEWVLQGKQKAYKRELDGEVVVQEMDIPTVVLLNSGTYEVIGVPEISCVKESSQLMMWTCMYNAELLQDELSVENFPHDHHEISIKLALQDRGREPGGRWDRRIFKVALATEDDTLDTSSNPKGFVITNLCVPEFGYDNKKGLQVDVYDLSIGMPNKSDEEHQEECIMAKLPIARESGYYDKNVVPALCLVTLVATSLLFLDAKYFFQRGSLLLNIAFIQIGLRISVDRYLPLVGYQVKIQKVMNQFFCITLWLCLESGVLYFLMNNFPEKVYKLTEKVSIQEARLVDIISAAFAILYMLYIICVYYGEMRKKSSILI